MAGSKSAGGKKKKQQNSVSQEAKDVQAWVASAPNDSIERLVKYVQEKRNSSSSRAVLLGGLYLLLKRPELAKARPTEPAAQLTNDRKLQLLELLGELVDEAVELLRSATAAAADVKKPSVVLAWATTMGLQKLAENSNNEAQPQMQELVISISEPFVKITDPQQWLEQWESPTDYPEPQDGGKSAEQLVAELGAKFLRPFIEIMLHTKQNAAPVVKLCKELEAIASGPAPGPSKAAADKPKAAAEKPKEEAKPKGAVKDSKAAAASREALRQKLEHESPPKQQQQASKREKDTDRNRDKQRGKAGDDKGVQELTEKLEQQKAAKAKAEQVLGYLKEATLAGKASTPEAHMAALQSTVAIPQQKVKEALNDVQKQMQGKAGKGAEAKGSDTVEATTIAHIGELLKNQFGPAADEKAVAGQLDTVLDKSSWMVFSEAGEGQKGCYYSSLQDFKQHAVAKQLDGKAAKDDLVQWGMETSDIGPDLKSAFELDFGGLLQDDALEKLCYRGKGKGGKDQANGFHVEDNQWMDVFQKDCPLRRCLFYHNRAVQVVTDASDSVVTELPGLTVGSMLTMIPRTATATGFALLQLQRGHVPVAVEDLSTATDWQIKAYQCLKLLLPLNHTDVAAESLDFAVYRYYCAEQATAELAQMLDPDLFESPAAAGGAGKAGGNSSSVGPSYTGGLVQDSVTMLGMLSSISALVEGALPVALQVYACKASGKPLPLPAKQGSEFRGKDVAAALQDWDRVNLLELRSFLLQVLPQYFAVLAVYQDFLDAVVNKRWRRRFVPVVQQGKANAKTYTLSPDYYAQACMAAALPYDDNVGCCTKHIRMREVQEGEEKIFNKYAVDTADQYTCSIDEDPPPVDPVRRLQRYVIQNARVTQAQQEKGLHPATEKGLEALINELYLPSQYDDQVPQPPTATPHRSGWETVRFYLVLASQLAVQREQLHGIITYHEERLQQGRDDTPYMRKAERGIMHQRAAGPWYCYEAWSKWHRQTADDLREEMDKLTRPKGQAKGGKVVKDREQQDNKHKERLDQLHNELEKADNCVSGLQHRLRDLLREVDAAAAAAQAFATTTTDAGMGMQQALHAVFGEMLDVKPPTEPLMRSRLFQVLRLARMTLFELDCCVMLYVCHAHTHALTTMWRVRQPAAAVVLVRYALGSHLIEQVKELHVQALIEADFQDKAQAASSKAAPSKKKKKKGPAPKKVVVEREPSEEEEEEEETAAAVGSEGEEAAVQGDEEALLMPTIDPRFLSMMESESEPDHRPAANQNSSSSARGAAGQQADSAARAAKAAEPAQSRPQGKPDSRDTKPPAARPAGDHHPQQQQQQPCKPAGRDAQHPGSSSSSGAAGPAALKPGVFTNVEDNTWVGLGPMGETVFYNGVVCVRCGQSDHPVQDCRIPYCSECDRFGHTPDSCSRACRTCGRLHELSVKCAVPCSSCKLAGHHNSNCFTRLCYTCKRFGHEYSKCRFCRVCGKEHDRGVPCCRKCKQIGHKDFDCRQCPECGHFGKGCVVGRCTNEQAAAAASSSSSRAAAAQRQAPPPSSSSGGRVAAAQALVPLPENVQLLNVSVVQKMQEEDANLLEKLVNMLIIRGLDEFVMGLLGNEEKLQSLLRVRKQDLEVWLQQRDAQRYLQGLLDHLENTKQQAAAQPAKQMGGQQQQPHQQQQDGGQRVTVRPNQLPPAVADVFEQQLSKVQLPAEWRSFSNWPKVENFVERWRGQQGQRVNMRDYAAAKRQAMAAAVAAGVDGSTGQGDGRRDSSSSSAAAGRQPSPPQQQEQQQRAAGEGPSGGSVPRDSTASHDSTGSVQLDGEALHPEDRRGSMQQQQQAAPGREQVRAFAAVSAPAGTAAAAPAGGARAMPPSSAMAAVLQQKQKQAKLAAASGQQQQQQVGPPGPPGFGAPGQPQQMGPSGASNSYATPNQQLSQQQQQQQLLLQGFEQAMQLYQNSMNAAYAVIRNRDNLLEPWMLWLKEGATRVLSTMAPPGPEQHHLLQLLEEDRKRDPTYTDMVELYTAFRGVWNDLPTASMPESERAPWRALGTMLDTARVQGLPEHLRVPVPAPTAAAAPAAPPAAAQFMPPHLRTAAAPGGMAHLPPHMLGGQPGMGAAAVQQPPLLQQQQQQAAADDGDESSDDLDILVGALMVPDAVPAPAVAAAAQPHLTSWEQVTGQALEADTLPADFPPLGTQPGEDADMQQALAASRADAAMIAASSRSIKTVPGISAAGLANQTGEYNCFLNVVVQCLWSCKAFTQEVRQLSMYDPHQVVEALLKLFGQMEEAETGWQPGRERPVIDPTGLRIALAEHTHFKCQEMNDANELLDTIYECFARSQHPGQHQGSRGILIDGVFGLLVTEEVRCRACGRETHKVPAHYEHLIVVNSASLSLAALSLGPVGMDQLLEFLFAQEQKFCDKDEGGCGEPNPRYRELIQGPQVLTLQLVWDQQVAGHDIREALGHVEEDLDITRMYDVMQVASTTFRLTSAVAYYGQHYMAFVFNTKLNTWLMFDDASVSTVGTWQDVINKCAAGRIQPGVLFYRLVDLTSLPDVTRSGTGGTPRHHQQQQQQAPAHVSMPYMHSGSSSSANAGLFGAPGGHHHAASAAAAHHAAAGHGLGYHPSSAVTAPAAAQAAPSSSSSSGLPASSNWGAKSHAAQLAAAAGVDPDELNAAAVAQRTGSSSDTWGTHPDSSSSGAGHHEAWGSSTAAAGVTSGSACVSSSSTGGWANSPMKGGAATGPAAAGGSSSGPQFGALGASALRGLGAPGGASTGPGGRGGRVGGRAGVGGRGGRGDGDERGWETARGRGRGRGPI